MPASEAPARNPHPSAKGPVGSCRRLHLQPQAPRPPAARSTGARRQAQQPRSRQRSAACPMLLFRSTAPLSDSPPAPSSHISRSHLLPATHPTHNPRSCLCVRALHAPSFFSSSSSSLHRAASYVPCMHPPFGQGVPRGHLGRFVGLAGRRCCPQLSQTQPVTTLQLQMGRCLQPGVTCRQRSGAGGRGESRKEEGRLMRRRDGKRALLCCSREQLR